MAPLGSHTTNVMLNRVPLIYLRVEAVLQIYMLESTSRAGFSSSLGFEGKCLMLGILSHAGDRFSVKNNAPQSMRLEEYDK